MSDSDVDSDGDYDRVCGWRCFLLVQSREEPGLFAVHDDGCIYHLKSFPARWVLIVSPA